MVDLRLHHVSIVATDLDRSVAFYRDLFALPQLERPAFSIPGAWFACGGLQLHIVHNPEGTFRTEDSVDNNDAHFAFNTDDFDGVLHRLVERGFREDAAKDDPLRLLVVRAGKAGFPQLYLRDPDRNIVEVNGAP